MSPLSQASWNVLSMVVILDSCLTGRKGGNRTGHVLLFSLETCIFLGNDTFKWSLD